MNKKIIAALVAVVGVILVYVLFVNSRAPVDEVTSAKISEQQTTDKRSDSSDEQESIVALAVNDLTLKFVGYGPGKSHEGSFSGLSVSDVRLNTQTNTPVAGTLIIDTATLSTGIAKLDGHLCSDDFFNCAVYPSIVFKFVEADIVSEGEYNVRGDLSFNGVTKRVEFPVSVKDNVVSADFLLDTTPFSFKYTGIDKNVRLMFSFTAVQK